MAALADPRFRRLFVGNALSSFGDSALYLSLGIWVKDLTGSSGASGAIFLVQGLASLIAPFTGQLVDRVPRRPLLLVTNAATALTVLALLLVRSDAQLWIMYAVALAYGTAFVILGGAGSALVKDLLPDQELAGANAASNTVGQGVRIASPVVGAAMYARFGGGSVAVLDAATFLGAIVALLSVRIEEPPRERRTLPSAAEFLGGLTYLRQTPALLRIVIAASAAQLVMGFYESLTFSAITALHRPASFFGVLMSVQAVGSIAGGLVAARLIRRTGEARTLGLGLAAWAIASLLYTLPYVPVACLALAVFGVAVPLYAVALATAVQRYTPRDLLGRVDAIARMATNLAQTVSIAVGAALVGPVGYRPLLITIAVTVSFVSAPMLVRPRAPSRSG